MISAYAQLFDCHNKTLLDAIKHMMKYLYKRFMIIKIMKIHIF